MSIIPPSFSLRARVLRAGTWTLAGYGLSQILRLGGNLILTRLLYPEAFGLMAIVMVVIYGVIMLTDVGIGQSIVQKNRGNDPAFLNTAWTIQIVRGVLIWCGLYALSSPIATLYGEPQLADMLPVVGLTAIISGFNSTKLFIAKRNLEAARVTQIEISTYTLGLLCTIYLAWLQESVWSLVWGTLITAFLKMVASHVALHGVRNKFAWDRDAVDQMAGFGRWILLSSSLTFLSIEGSRLLIGAFLDMRQLALYTLASTMSLLFWQALLQLASHVLFPAYSEINRTNPDNLVAALYKTRLALLLPGWGAAVLFTFFGVKIMGILYDPRYHDSGAMLEVLAAGSFAKCIWGSYAGILVAVGKVATETLMTAVQIVCQIFGMLIGYHYWGDMGIIAGVAAANWMMYPISTYIMFRNGLWHAKYELMILAVSMLAVLFAWKHMTQIIMGS